MDFSHLPTQGHNLCVQRILTIPISIICLEHKESFCSLRLLIAWGESFLKLSSISTCLLQDDSEINSGQPSSLAILWINGKVKSNFSVTLTLVPSEDRTSYKLSSLCFLWGTHKSVFFLDRIIGQKS